MMTDEQRFLFDLQGYLVVPEVLDAAMVQRMRAAMDAHGVSPPEEKSDDYRFGDFLRWSDDFRRLIDHPQIMPILVELLGPRFRLDHAYGMATRPKSEGQAAEKAVAHNLHHTAGMFHHGCCYVTHGSRIHNGLIVVSVALTDIAPGSGGFCCIPGSHKAIFLMPRHLFQIEENPLVRQVPQKAGDALIFTEALTHGTWPWADPRGGRRSVLLKYAPHYMQWAGKPMDATIDGLTERQRLILAGAYVWQRPSIPTSEQEAAAD
jgi:ectoine hydroxylase-related dioxygenase (phytanoyl-CoA dioxygenase family)